MTVRLAIMLVLGAVTIAAVASGRPNAGGRLAVTVGPSPPKNFNADLWVVSPGHGAKPIVPTKRTGIRDPSWSPSGRQIAFTVARDPINERGLDIYVAGADGGHRQRLTGAGAAEYTPAWSPNGRTIAFARNRGAQAPSVWLMRPDGRGQRRVTYGSSPAWSPDARRLVFTNEHVLWVIGRDGSGRHRLTPQPTDPSCDFSGGESSDYEGAPDWSPSGRWIAFVRYCGSGESGGEVDSIYVIHPDGTGLRRLTVGPVDDSPSWSPDGGRVAFVRLFHVAVVARGGGTVRTLFALRRHEVYDVAWERGTNAKTRR